MTTRVTIQGLGNKGNHTFIFEVDATVDVKVCVDGIQQAWCDERMAEFFGDTVYEHPSYKLVVGDGAMITVIGKGFQVAIVGSMEDWQWTKVGDVDVHMNTVFNER